MQDSIHKLLRGGGKKGRSKDDEKDEVKQSEHNTFVHSLQLGKLSQMQAAEETFESESEPELDLLESEDHCCSDSNDSNGSENRVKQKQMKSRKRNTRKVYKMNIIALKIYLGWSLVTSWMEFRVNYSSLCKSRKWW